MIDLQSIKFHSNYFQNSWRNLCFLFLWSPYSGWNLCFFSASVRKITSVIRTNSFSPNPTVFYSNRTSELTMCTFKSHFLHIIMRFCLWFLPSLLLYRYINMRNIWFQFLSFSRFPNLSFFFIYLFSYAHRLLCPSQFIHIVRLFTIRHVLSLFLSTLLSLTHWIFLISSLCSNLFLLITLSNQSFGVNSFDAMPNSSAFQRHFWSNMKSFPFLPITSFFILIICEYSKITEIRLPRFHSLP